MSELKGLSEVPQEVPQGGDPADHRQVLWREVEPIGGVSVGHVEEAKQEGMASSGDAQRADATEPRGGFFKGFEDTDPSNVYSKVAPEQTANWNKDWQEFIEKGYWHALDSSREKGLTLQGEDRLLRAMPDEILTDEWRDDARKLEGGSEIPRISAYMFTGPPEDLGDPRLARAQEGSDGSGSPPYPPEKEAREASDAPGPPRFPDEDAPEAPPHPRS